MEYVPGGDDQPLTYVRRDLSGGMNTRVHGSEIGQNQATVLYNADIGTPSQTTKRPGISLIQDIGSAGVALYGFEPQGGTNQLVGMESTNLQTWPASGSFTNRKNNFTSTTRPCVFMGKESGEGDVIFVGNGTDNWFRMNQSYTFQDLGNTNTSPPICNVGTYYRSRFWALSSEKLYWSDAADDDYSGAFDRTTNNYNMPVGAEMALVGLRDLGLICFGQRAVYAINPSTTPAATDKTEKLYDQGCLAGGSVCQVGDDIFFLAPDGIRSLVRTQQDKVQLGASFPLSYPLRNEFNNLSTAYISKAQAVYFDNKYFIALPDGSSTYNNTVWVYYPATQGWMVITGWNVGAWAKLKVSGQERLYYIDGNDGSVYRAWYGNDDNSAAINYQEESRKDDMGQPFVKKYGGYLKVKAATAGDYNLTISAATDDADYSVLGTMNLLGSSPTLPVVLPFVLVDTVSITQYFPLDALGEWDQIRTKIQHNATNGSDEIKILERSIITNAGEFVPV